MNKTLLIALLFLCGCESRNSVRNQIRACEEMDVHFGDKVTPRVGFYKGLKMVAVGKGRTAIEVEPETSLIKENLKFYCEDLMIVERK